MTVIIRSWNLQHTKSELCYNSLTKNLVVGSCSKVCDHPEEDWRWTVEFPKLLSYARYCSYNTKNNSNRFTNLLHYWALKRKFITLKCQVFTYLYAIDLPARSSEFGQVVGVRIVPLCVCQSTETNDSSKFIRFVCSVDFYIHNSRLSPLFATTTNYLLNHAVVAMLKFSTVWVNTPQDTKLRKIALR